ncbi:hypothetical protein MP228_004393 [Amoeboaphelidium protococcarum]|nr:hypothetical protein MP228_004393 [Amoeboaphelidium protococcarum]
MVKFARQKKRSAMRRQLKDRGVENVDDIVLTSFIELQQEKNWTADEYYEKYVDLFEKKKMIHAKFLKKHKRPSQSEMKSLLSSSNFEMALKQKLGTLT